MTRHATQAERFDHDRDLQKHDAAEKGVKAKLCIEFVKADEFGVVPGSGWVIKENGKRIDWPMLATREEAVVDVVDFQRSRRQLASDEASERNAAVAEPLRSIINSFSAGVRR